MHSQRQVPDSGRETTTPAPLPPEIARIEDHSRGSVVDFVAEETVPAAETNAIGSDELHLAYVRWCKEKGRVVLPAEPFSREFDRLRELPALRDKIRKF